jgi:phosphatidylglycerophosphate synthase
MRHASIHLTRLLVNSRVTPNLLTWSLVAIGIGAALVMTVPRWWAAVLAAVLIQLQGLVDCMDGELARWRRQFAPVGIYADRIAHYVTDAGLAVAVGVRADGGLTSMNGWTMIGLCAGFVVLITKSETDLVHTSRALSGLPPAKDTTAVAQSHASLVRRLRRLAGNLPFNRALLAMELTFLALVGAVIDAARGGLTATRVLDVALLVIAGIVAVGHLLAIVTSDRLR